MCVYMYHSRTTCRRSRSSVYSDGSVAEWLACWTQAQKGPGSNRSRRCRGNSLRQTVHTHRVPISVEAVLILRTWGIHFPSLSAPSLLSKSSPLLFPFPSSFRFVDGSYAEHLTVESYTVVICQQSYLLLLVFHHPLTLSFQA